MAEEPGGAGQGADGLAQAWNALVATARRTVADGLVVGTSGNVSVRVGDTVLVTPSGVPYDELTPDDARRRRPRRRAGAGTLTPTSELPMHLAVYRATPRPRRRPHPRRPRHRRLHPRARTPADPLHGRGPRRTRPGRPVRDVRHRAVGRERASTLSRGGQAACSRTTAPSPTATPSPRPTTARPSSNGCAASGSPRLPVPGHTPTLLHPRPGARGGGAAAGLRAAGPERRRLSRPPAGRRSPPAAPHWPRRSPGRDTGRCAPPRATAAAVTAVIAAGAAARRGGRFASDAALKARPGRPLPTEPRLTVHATAAGRITLTRDLASLRPGTYGLERRRIHAVVGPVLDAAPHAARHRRAPPGARHPRLPRTRRQGLAHAPKPAHRRPRGRRSAWTTPTSTSPANWARCPPGSCPASATPGSSPCTAWAPPASTP